MSLHMTQGHNIDGVAKYGKAGAMGDMWSYLIKVAMPKFGSVRFCSLLARTGTRTAAGESRTEPEPGLNRQNRFFQFGSGSVLVRFWFELRTGGSEFFQ